MDVYIHIFYFLARIFETRKKEYTVLKMCKSECKTLLCEIMESIIEHIHGQSVLWNIIILVMLIDLRSFVVHSFVLRLFVLHSFVLRALVTALFWRRAFVLCTYFASSELLHTNMKIIFSKQFHTNMTFTLTTFYLT